jgi:hypothetical protein
LRETCGVHLSKNFPVMKIRWRVTLLGQSSANTLLPTFPFIPVHKNFLSSCHRKEMMWKHLGNISDKEECMREGKAKGRK